MPYAVCGLRVSETRSRATYCGRAGRCWVHGAASRRQKNEKNIQLRILCILYQYIVQKNTAGSRILGIICINAYFSVSYIYCVPYCVCLFNAFLAMLEPKIMGKNQEEAQRKQQKCDMRANRSSKPVSYYTHTDQELQARQRQAAPSTERRS